MQSDPPVPRSAPDHAVFSRATTASVAAGDRLDFWRHLFLGAQIDLQDRERPADFHGELIGGAGAGSAFLSLRSDPVVSRFGRPELGVLLLGVVHGGAWQVRHGHDGTTVLDPESGLVLFDCDRPAIVQGTRHSLSYLALPRAAVIAAMGRPEPVPPGEAFLRLPAGGLSPVLVAHLRAMGEHGIRLNEAEGAAAIQAATGLAMTLLAGLRTPPERQDGRYDDALFAAAQRYIALNCGRFDLTADDVAGAVGCSRAHLYRLFALRDRTVAGELREVRLRQARRLIETQSSRPIGLIAFDCGYTDLSAFGKAFKRRFGLGPSDWRAAAGRPPTA